MKCFCFDLDGTLYRGDEPAEYAAELVSLLQKRNIPYAAVTNCPMRAPEETAARLEKMGIPMPAERVISSGMTAARVLAERGEKSVYVVGSPALKKECESRGLLVSQSASAVLIGFDKGITYEDMNTACKLAMDGARLYCTNTDPVIPQGGRLIPHTGAIAAMAEYAVKKRCIYIGKPEKYMMQDCMRIFAAQGAHAEKSEIYVVGDRADTDMAFARNCGVTGCMVLTGTGTRKEALDAGIPGEYIFQNLARLKERLLED